MRSTLRDILWNLDENIAVATMVEGIERLKCGRESPEEYLGGCDRNKQAMQAKQAPNVTDGSYMNSHMEVWRFNWADLTRGEGAQQVGICTCLGTKSAMFSRYYDMRICVSMLVGRSRKSEMQCECRWAGECSTSCSSKVRSRTSSVAKTCVRGFSPVYFS